MIVNRYLNKNPLALKIFSSILGACLFIICREQGSRFAARIGWVEYQGPMMTQLPPGTEDWRNAHITADKFRQPDPLLWWRPRNGPPYNEQGFKGPVVAIPKPANTLRILVYGDSNTEGLPEDSWPSRLQSELNRIHSQ